MQFSYWSDIFTRFHAAPRSEESVSVWREEDTIQQAVQGDAEAFGRLYEQYVTRIFNYVYYRTGNLYDAEDLTERVFMRAMRHIGNYRNRGVPFSAWLYRIAHNLVANWHRDMQRRREIPLQDAYPLPGKREHPEDRVLASEEREALLNLIRDLPPERQQLLILKFVERLSNAEIGAIMGRTEGAIKSLYHRTLTALRAEIENHEIFLPFPPDEEV
ncbi:MAG TPA: sigma-70 family RNA polymerase sigma factor [Chloroflexi bacterium]|nr:sigma-70 family RNA polymerase sigma factor [Chloroflexota bacterium]